MHTHTTCMQRNREMAILAATLFILSGLAALLAVCGSENTSASEADGSVAIDSCDVSLDQISFAMCADSGTSGGCVWHLSGDTLYIEPDPNGGNGYMADYTDSGFFGRSPWAGSSFLKSVVVSEGVRSIGAYSFDSCRGISSVSLPSTLETIGVGCFDGCSSMASLTIPISAKIDGTHPFYGCNSLQNVTFTKGDGSGVHLFDVASLCEMPWYKSREVLKTVTFCDGVTEVWDYAFAGYSALQQVTLPGTVSHIGEGAFAQCGNLRTVYLGSHDLRIDNCAFMGSGLTSVSLSGGQLGIGVFADCQSLTNVTLLNFREVPAYAFYECGTLTSVCLDGAVERIGDCAFQGCTSLASVKIPYYTSVLGDSVFQGCTSLTAVTFGPSLVTIGNSVFQGCTALAVFTVPDSVTSMGYNVFRDCTSLEEITVSSSVSEVGYAAFANCTSLRYVTFGHLEDIGDYAFYECSKLFSFRASGSVGSIGCAAFYGCSSLTDLNMFGWIGSIGDYAFARCTGISSVNLDASYVGYYAFYGCTSLTFTSLGDSVRVIASQAFGGCDSLNTVVFGCGLKYVASDTFPGAFHNWDGSVINPVSGTSAVRALWGHVFTGDAENGYYISGCTSTSSDVHVEIARRVLA